LKHRKLKLKTNNCRLVGKPVSPGKTRRADKYKGVGMALSKETARKIVEAVAVDPNCRSSIEPNNALNQMGSILNPGTDLLLRFTHLAGPVRNIPLVAKGIIQGKNLEDDPEATAKLCIGITAVTVKAIHNAIRQSKLPEVHGCSGTHRVHWGVHHEATWIRMKDGSEYVFDWHATLKINDPVISKADDWQNGRTGINFVLFAGFQ
jgi:hypothetical protein